MSSNAFRICEPCGGMGFLRSGEFSERTFPRCPKCLGIGQSYIDPVAEVTAFKVNPRP